MRLTLKLMSINGRPADTHVEQSFESFPVVIGRAASCDFRLNDPSKYISSTHAVIMLERGQFSIEDSSSNGTYINGSTEPVGRGKSVPLSSGASLTIGDYSLSIEIMNQPAAQSRPSDPVRENQPFDKALTAAADPFDPFSEAEHDWTPASSQFGLDDNRNRQEDLLPQSTPSTDDDWHDWPESGSSAAQPPGNPADEFDWLPSDANETVSAPKPITHPGSMPISATLSDSHFSPERKSRSRSDLSSGLEALLRGAGLDARQFSQADSAQVLEMAGRMLAESTDGLMVLLQSRAELKNAIRTDVTRLARQDNNPLKFSTDVEDALVKLLMPQVHKGYQGTEASITEAVDDLKTHHLAMLDGMKAAVRAVLNQFDPHKLEKKLESANPIAANIPITREAKLWQLFNECYGDIRDEAVSDFNELFGREFRKAYNRRTRDLDRKPDF